MLIDVKGGCLETELVDRPTPPFDLDETLSLYRARLDAINGDFTKTQNSGRDLKDCGLSGKAVFCYFRSESRKANSGRRFDHKW